MKTEFSSGGFMPIVVIFSLFALVAESGARPFGARAGHGHSYVTLAHPQSYGYLGHYGNYRRYGYYGYGGYGGYGRYGYRRGYYPRHGRYGVYGFRHGGLYSYYPAYVPRTAIWGRGSSGLRIYSSSHGPASLSATRPPVYVMRDVSSVEEQREEAWRRLVTGDDAGASQTFEAMEQQLPGKAWPKVGTGLVAGFSGDYWMATYRFRRAFRFDGAGPGEVPATPEFHKRLTRLANYYRGVMARGGGDEDAAFMVAALTYLAKDYSSAQTAIQSAIMGGDVSRSAIHLNRLVEHAMVAAQESRPLTAVAFVE